MYTIVITTKNSSSEEYNTIVENWFAGNVKKVSVEPTIKLWGQPGNNMVKVAESDSFRVVLPQVVNSSFLVRDKSEYVLDLLCTIADRFMVAKDDLFFVVHSSDLFNDYRGGYGIVPICNLECSAATRQKVVDHIAEGHIFQFHHETNPVKILLIDKQLDEGQDITVLGQALMRLFK